MGESTAHVHARATSADTHQNKGAERRRNVTIRLPSSLVEAAHAAGLNISRITEQALKAILFGGDTVPAYAQIPQGAQNSADAWARGAAWRARGLAEQPEITISNSLLRDFEEWMVLNEYRDRKHPRSFIRRLMKFSGGCVTPEVVGKFYASFKNHAPNTRRNVAKALIMFFRKFLGRPEFLEHVHVRWGQSPPRYTKVPPIEAWRNGWNGLKNDWDRVAYLLTLTTGLRAGEILALEWQHIDLDERIVIPNMWRRTKRTGITFITKEAQAWLRYWREQKGNPGPEEKVLAPHRSNYRLRTVFKRASKVAGTKLTPQLARVWFSYWMLAHGVSEAYVNIFTGHVPRNVLEAHYTPRQIELLREIYDSAAPIFGFPALEEAGCGV